MEKLRIRLVFEDPDILSDVQKSEGLNKSWFLVEGEKCPKIRDLYALLLRIFDLNRSCPNGLLLYMDGFVLPLFETTCILKDKDIISVKKKGGTSTDIVKVGDTVEEPEVVEKQQLQTVVPLLANEEFEKEEGEYQSESEDNEEQSEDGLHLENISREKAFSKKRKSSTKLKRNKKHRLVIPDGVGEGNHKDQIQSNHDNGVLSRKSPRKKEKKSMTKSKKKRGITAPESADGSSSTIESTSSAKSDKPQQNEKGTEATLDTPKKLPSRSARRKKAKRQWLRAMNNISKKNAVSDTKEPPNQKQRRAKVEKKEVVCQSKGLLYWKPSREGHNDTKIGHKESSEKNDEHENVPIFVRPGHIRFEPLEEDQAVQQSEVLMETFQWNGITSKRKGQKWGTERTSSNQRNGYQHFNNDHPDVSNIEKKITTSDPVDFDKLHPLTGLPKEGDVIVYRLLELSSTWTPELSSFRVGRVFWYKPESSAILLLPVPEYPILDKLDEDGSVTQADNFLYKEDESVAQPDNSLYKEDGSLEVDFSSLVDVRILKHSNSDSGIDVSHKVNKSPLCNKSGIPSLEHDDGDKQKHTPGTDKGDVNLWDQLSEALDEKKAELAAENNWIKGTSGRSSWKYGAARGSAVGPVMARLRLQKHI